MEHEVVDTLISPEGQLEVLSKAEVAKLLDTSQGGLYNIFRKCALAVLNCGSSIDDGKELLERYKSFDISIVQRERGIKLEIKGAPAIAFVDGKMIKGIHEHLFAVLRDIVFISIEVTDNPKFDMSRTGRHHRLGLPHPAQRERAAAAAQSRTWWCAGAATRSTASNTTIRRKSATRWACATWISAPAAARAP